MKAYETLDNVLIDGRISPPGELILLDGDTAGPLLAAGVIADPEIRRAEQSAAEAASLPAGLEHLTGDHLLKLRAMTAAEVDEALAPRSPETTPTVEAALDTALSALRQATPEQVRAFAVAAAEDPEIAADSEVPLEAALAVALNALRKASPEEVGVFVGAMGADPDIAWAPPAIGETEEDPAAASAQEVREERLIGAIATLEVGNREHFTGSGKPLVDALEATTGLNDVTAAERDVAWEKYQGLSGG